MYVRSLVTMKLRVAFAVVALLLVAASVAGRPVGKSEGALINNSGQYLNFTYNTTTGLATWTFRIGNTNDTFATTITFNPVQPAGSIITASLPPGSCAPVLPSAAPIACNAPAGTLSYELTITTPYTRQCTAQVVAIGPVTATQTAPQVPSMNVVVSTAASTQSSVGG